MHRPPAAAHACTLKGEGQGGAAGFASGQAEVQLAPDGAGTALSYRAQATIGGRLAQMGQRLLDATAKSMADEFFANFAKQLAGARRNIGARVAHRSRAAQSATTRASAPQIWLVGLIGIVIILLIVFGIAL